MSDAPWSEDAENVVLGYFLVAGGVNHETFDGIKNMFCSEDFYGPGNKEIYDSICRLRESFEEINYYTVLEDVRSKGKASQDNFYNCPENADNLGFILGRIVREYVNAMPIKAYADIVKCRADLRNRKNVVKFVKKDKDDG